MQLHPHRKNRRRQTARRFFCCIALIAGVFGTSRASAAGESFSDSFDHPERWKLIASDGVLATTETVNGESGGALRLNYDFSRGAGYCILRREMNLVLPANYRFTLRLRGEAPANNLEFKLVDQSGDNVWWINRRDFQPPREWSTLTQRARNFRFAWGPAGGKPLERISAIEIAVACSQGGKGAIDFDELAFEPLSPISTTQSVPRVRLSSTESGATTFELPQSGVVNWRPTESTNDARLTIEFGQPREYGGLRLEWDGPAPPRYAIRALTGSRSATILAGIIDSDGDVDYVQTPDSESDRIEIVFPASVDRFVLKSLQILPPEFGESRNRMLQTIAADFPRGVFPRYFLSEPVPWTIVGAPAAAEESLVDVDGAVELMRGGFRIEPFLRTSNAFFSWSNAEINRGLLDGFLPIPIVTWRAGPFELEIMAFGALGPADPQTIVRYRLRNRSGRAERVTLALAARPFQVLPPWQELNLTGGAARVDELSMTRECAAAGAFAVHFSPPADSVAATTFDSGEIVTRLAAAKVPNQSVARDRLGLASGAVLYEVALDAGADRAIVVSSALHGTSPAISSGGFDRQLAQTRAFWTESVNRARIVLPASANGLVNSFKTAQAHILLTADGPALQPGARTYERSWIRDGAIMANSLLYTGHPDEVRAFLNWFAAFQYPDGKIPCVADRRGADPVPEHDSTGEYLCALSTYYRFTRDRELLTRHLPHVVRAIDYIESLRAQRLSDDFRTGPDEKRVFFGLVPESISHEGYSAKPMHSYWDNFWLLRGVRDAIAMARALDQPDLEQRCQKLYEDYKTCVRDSIARAMRIRNINFIPGCAELGDFDATSTAIAVYPCNHADWLPRDALDTTFDRYLRFFRDRRDGKLDWRDLTPYEIRLAGVFVRLGQPAAAHELLDYFLRQQTPPAWNQWPEVAYRDPRQSGFVGDLPHTWVAAEFINAVRSLFVYEDDARQALVLDAGVRPEWLAAADAGAASDSARAPVAIEDFPTAYGSVSFSLSRRGDKLSLHLAARGTVPPGGFILRWPQPLASAEIDGAAAPVQNEKELRINSLQADVLLQVRN